MAIKRRVEKGEQIAARAAKAEKLANAMADKPYGKPGAAEAVEMTTTSIALPVAMLHKLEDLATANKRAGIEPKSVSALIREAIINNY